MHVSLSTGEIEGDFQHGILFPLQQKNHEDKKTYSLRHPRIALEG